MGRVEFEKLSKIVGWDMNGRVVKVVGEGGVREDVEDGVVVSMVREVLEVIG